MSAKPPPRTTNPNITGNHKTIRIAITNIDDNLSSNYEHGFGLYNRGNFPEHGPYAHHIEADQVQHVRFPPKIYQFGTIHTHPVNDNAIPMFSPSDIYSLLQLRNFYGTGSSLLPNSNTSGDALFVAVLAVKQGSEIKTYAIKIKNYLQLQTLLATRSSRKDWVRINDLYSRKFTEEADGVDGSPLQYQKTFLNFVKDNNLGVSLYEMEQVNSGTANVQEHWKELTLNGNTIKKTPCNN